MKPGANRVTLVMTVSPLGYTTQKDNSICDQACSQMELSPGINSSVDQDSNYHNARQVLEHWDLCDTALTHSATVCPLCSHLSLGVMCTVTLIISYTGHREGVVDGGYLLVVSDQPGSRWWTWWIVSERLTFWLCGGLWMFLSFFLSKSFRGWWIFEYLRVESIR